jgi:hypothetical protein
MTAKTLQNTNSPPPKTYPIPHLQLHKQSVIGVAIIPTIGNYRLRPIPHQLWENLRIVHISWRHLHLGIILLLASLAPSYLWLAPAFLALFSVLALRLQTPAGR